MDDFEIKPFIGIGPFHLKMSKEEIWAISRSPISSWFTQKESNVRSDDFTILGIHVHYDENSLKASQITAFTKLYGKNPVDLIFLKEKINDFSREDILSLLDLYNIQRTATEGIIYCPEIELTIGFKEEEDIPTTKDKIEYLFLTINRTDALGLCDL